MSNLLYFIAALNAVFAVSDLYRAVLAEPLSTSIAYLVMGIIEFTAVGMAVLNANYWSGL